MSAGPEAGHGSRGDASLGVIPTGSYMAGDGGGTYTKSDRNPSIQEYESVFGPSARDIKEDPMRSKRHQRWHLPDVLKGPNPYLTDRIDGLITDTTNSPFTSTILPYTYLEHPDAKIKWNVWSFDEGMANRVPYESAARVLTQSKQSFAGYTVRQGLAITMEHNFMMSPEGRVNFSNQLKQMVGSIQYTNDLDVHIALITAPSYARKINEKYYSREKNVWQRCRQYVDLFGIMQKTPNALDLIIEDTKSTLKSWGSQDPSFLLTNSKLTMQLQMTPERTQYVTQGPDGLKRLADGPNLTKYRGLDVIHSRSFSTETGARPRDLLDRRVRVAEYYVVHDVNSADIANLKVRMYDQSKDTMFVMSGDDLLMHAVLPNELEIFSQTEDATGLTRGSASRTEKPTLQQARAIIGKMQNQNQAKPPSSSRTGGSTYVCDTWEKVARQAAALRVSIHELIVDNNVFVSDREEIRYLVQNAITMPVTVTTRNGHSEAETVWKPFSSAEMIHADITNAFKLWKAGELNPGRTHFLGPAPAEAHVAFLLEHVEYPPTDTIIVGKIRKLLGYAMGFPLGFLEEVGPQTSYYKDSRLFMLNAWLSAQNTDDEKLFDNVSIFGSQDMTEWFRTINTVGDWNAAVRRTFKASLEVNGSSANFGDEHDTSPIDARQSMCHLVRQTMLVLFAKSDPDGYNHGASITLNASRGLFMGYQMDSSLYTNSQGPPGSVYPSFPGQIDPAEYEDNIFVLAADEKQKFDIVMIRPNIEHNMLGVVMGRGGKDDLGATFWGQTELSVYDDGMHGKWGMSYKYHERAIVLNEKNLMRCWDVAFNGYNGGNDDTFMKWEEPTDTTFRDSCNNLDRPYDGDSICCMIFPAGQKTWPNPVVLSANAKTEVNGEGEAWIDPDNLNSVYDTRMNVFGQDSYQKRFEQYAQHANFPDFRMLHSTRKNAGSAANDGVTAATSVAFQGTIMIDRTGSGAWEHIRGAGHLGDSYVGCASVREGKGFRQDSAPSVMRVV